jgi:type IX secretion system PorP/SprF family membrane protein
LIKRISILFITYCIYLNLNAQDPFLSQMYGAAQFLSPATVGSGIYQSRAQANYRSQTMAGNSLYRTIVAGWDGRYKNKNPEFQNYLGLGGQIISDQVMNGILQTNYATFNAAYHIYFDEEVQKNFSLGLGVTFTQSNLQLDKLKFYDQFAQGNFINSATSISLQNLNSSASKISVNTGLLYTKHNENSFFQLSANAFFMSKPELTIYNNAEASTFKSLVFFNFEKEVNDNKKTVMVHASYSNRNNMNQLLMGAAFSLPFGSYYEYVNRVYAGLFYRVGDAVIPQFSILMNQYRFGVSYDVYSRGMTGAVLNPNSFELSFSTSFGKKRNNNFRTIFD